MVFVFLVYCRFVEYEPPHARECPAFLDLKSRQRDEIRHQFPFRCIILAYRLSSDITAILLCLEKVILVEPVMLNLRVVPVLNFIAFSFRARYLYEAVTLLQELVNAFKAQPERFTN